MKKKIFIAISALILCAVIAFLVFLSLGRGGGEIGFYATVLSIEGDIITVEVTKDEASSIFSKKLPDKIAFGTTVSGADNLKVGDKIYDSCCGTGGFLLECFKIFTEEKERECKKAAACSLFLAFLISLARTQMMVTILIWMAVAGARIVLWPKNRWRRRTWQNPRNGKWKIRHLLIMVVIVAAVFILRTLAVKSYNLVFNGHFINNTYGTVNTLTNILYAADREDGERIRDQEAREFFFRMYDLAEERRANYKYAGSSLREKTEHIEAWHDTIKYEMIEDVFYQTYDKTVTSDYIIQNLMADETAGKIIRGILPGCFFRWFGNYLLIASYGAVRSIAVVHPLVNWAAFFIYVSALALTLFVWRKNRENPAVPVMLISLLAILANVGAVSITIMCLSRYMIYGFAPFYTGYFLLLLSLRER